MGLWQLLHALKLNRGVIYNPSDSCVIQPRLCYDRRLDPIPADLPGRFHYRGLGEYAPWAARAERTISEPEYFEAHILHHDIKRTPNPRWSGETDARYHSHIEELAKVRLIIEFKGKVFILCRYFAVPKGDDLARSIFDGRAISFLCITPPILNLPDPVEIARFLAEYATIGVPAMNVLDLRHFFHQIKLHDRISEHFTIIIGGRVYRWSTVPMGWSHSPAVAQALSLAMVLAALERVKHATCEQRASPELPEFLEIKRTSCGSTKPQLMRVYVTYDNICFVGNSELSREVRDAFVVECRNRHLIIKEGSESGFSEADVKHEKTASRCQTGEDGKR